MKTETETLTQYPFTKTQFNGLNQDERAAILSIIDYVTGETPSTINDEILSRTLNLWRSTGLCVPEEEVGDNLHGAVRYKYSAIYSPASAAAEAELASQGVNIPDDCSLRVVIDASFEDATRVAVIDEKQLACYEHHQSNAWQFHFENLAAMAREFLRIKQTLIAKVLAKHTIFIVMDGGLVQEVRDIPPDVEVQVIDYDTEGADHLNVSPLDGEACVLTEYSS